MARTKEKQNTQTKKQDVEVLHPHTKQEQDDWETLYFYVRKEIMGYDENQSLSKYSVLRLRGMKYGKFVDKNSEKDMSRYTYNHILLTFKFCAPQINIALRSIQFKDEKHKINYVLKIVEDNLNTVYMRLKKSEEMKQKTEEACEEMKADERFFGRRVEYQRKTEEAPEMIKGLW